MAVSLGAVLQKQFNKLGIPITDAIKALTEINALVPHDIAKRLDKELLTVEAAKKNTEVNKALRQKILAAADAKIDEQIVVLNLQPGDDFLYEKNTYQKIAIITRLAYETATKKSMKAL